MPELRIDGHTIVARPGTKIIDAAEQVGIIIPRFCYHPALGAVGACRVCAVNILEGPVTGIKMSCRTDVADGMVVSTTDATAVDFRRHVIEWLMLNHPHDCPVCDEGGHCLLQDLTVSGGHGKRRFKGNKRTYEDQYMGPLVQHEMNRCIQCYRCSRFYQEYTGYRDLGVMGIASRVYFGRYQAGTLKSPYAGNLIDICPTGVYTDRPSRYTARQWDYERRPSICIHCSLGCSLTVNARYRQIVRQEARYHPMVNGHFICDRGRYGFYYANLEDRPRNAVVDKQPTTSDRAIQVTNQRLEAIGRKYGSSAVAALSSSRCSLETLGAVAKLCRHKGWQGPFSGLSRQHLKNVQAAAAHLGPENVLSLAELQAFEAIMVVGADPLSDAPMLALSIRQAVRKGADVLILDPRPLDLPFEYRQLAATPREINHILGGVVETNLENVSSDDMPGESGRGPDIRHVVAFLMQGRRTAIVCGTDTVDHHTISHCAKLASRLQPPAGVLFVLPGANSYGAALVNQGAAAIEDLLSKIETGDIKGLLVVEGDPFWNYPDRVRLRQAFNQLELIVVMDHVPTQATDAASIFIPTRTIYESGGIFINHEGRLQKTAPVFSGGVPVRITGGGSHPPRVFNKSDPGSEVKAAWELLGAMEKTLDDQPRENLRQWMRQTFPVLDSVLQDLPEAGKRIYANISTPAQGDLITLETAPVHETGFQVLMTEEIFGTEFLSSFSACLRQLAKEPYVWMNARRAESLGLLDCKAVWITAGAFEMKWNLKTSPLVPESIIIMPRLAHAERQLPDLCAKRLKSNQVRGADGPI